MFGPLSVEGGENRLNVAITRAKEKVYVVTSIEPEELNVENSKNAGPKIFKSYLQYARAISNGNNLEAELILKSYDNVETPKNSLINSAFENEIKKELENLGYTIATNIGNTDYKISLAIYDKTLDKYLVGVECDYTAYQSSDSLIERDVYHPAFLKSRGWEIIRVFSRDWWLHKSKVISQITKTAERTKQKYLSENNSKTTKSSTKTTQTNTKSNTKTTQTNTKSSTKTTQTNTKSSTLKNSKQTNVVNNKTGNTNKTNIKKTVNSSQNKK